MPDLKKSTFRIQFHNSGRIYELYANQVCQSQMAGFIEISDIIFGEQSKVLIDPAEEKLKTEFANVKHAYIPHHLIIRIDEVEKSGKNRILDATDSTVTTFPGSRVVPHNH